MSGQTKDEDEYLESPDRWDFDKAETQEPVRSPRAIVSVAFSRDDFERVAAWAEKRGQKLSTMIREVVLASLPGSSAAGISVSVSGADASDIDALSDALGSWQPSGHQDGTAVLAPS